jgi:hypothetical protein
VFALLRARFVFTFAEHPKPNANPEPRTPNIETELEREPRIEKIEV